MPISTEETQLYTELSDVRLPDRFLVVFFLVWRSGILRFGFRRVLHRCFVQLERKIPGASILLG